MRLSSSAKVEVFVYSDGVDVISDTWRGVQLVSALHLISFPFLVVASVPCRA